MKLLFFAIFLLSACDLQELFYPADEHLSLPNGREMRLHCNPDCPSHEEIITVMGGVANVVGPHLTHNSWAIWSHYAITFGDYEIYCNGGLPGCPEGTQVHGYTDHNRQGIYIYTGDEYKGLRPGVLDWELRLPLVESMIRYSSEAEKIEWLAERGLL
jgi:hypothetical protein